MFLIVDNMLNQQQNKDILHLCERVGLEHVRIEAHNVNGEQVFFSEGQNIFDSLDKGYNDYFLLGSYGLAESIKAKGFLSGHNLSNLTQDIQIEKWGSSSFLNGEHSIVNACTIAQYDGVRFFRPLIDTKAFLAGVYTFDEVLPKLSDESLIMSSVKDIQAEYRFIIVNGVIADSSSYKIGAQVSITEKAPFDFTLFVESLLSTWIPTEHFALDVASIDGEPKIIEVNNIHCSRFYGCSLSKIIEKVLYKI